ncbi:MAG: thioredoxin family protein [Planctomycetota bacterium]
MTGSRPVMVALVTFLVAMMASHAAADGVLKTLSLSRAMSRHDDRGGMLVVMATASWCGPCQRMKSSTWGTQRVTSWFEEHGMAAAIDGDRHKNDMRTLGVRGYPTLIAFYEGEEVGRFSGYRSSRQFVSWLDSMWEKSGAVLPDASTQEETEPETRRPTRQTQPALTSVTPQETEQILDVIKRRGEPAAPTDRALPAEFEQLRAAAGAGGAIEHLAYITALVEDGGFDRFAAEVAVDAMARRTGCSLLLAESLATLAGRSESKQVLRDAQRVFGERAEPGAAFNARDATAWFALNSAMGLHSTNRRWVVTMLHERPEADRVPEITGPMVVALADAGKWRSAARLIEDPVMFVASACGKAVPSVPAVWPMPLCDDSASLLIARAYAACLAVNRKEDAAAIAEAAVERLELPEADVRRRLAEMARAADATLPVHDDWLATAPIGG